MIATKSYVIKTYRVLTREFVSYAYDYRVYELGCVYYYRVVCYSFLGSCGVFREFRFYRVNVLEVFLAD